MPLYFSNLHFLVRVHSTLDRKRPRGFQGREGREMHATGASGCYILQLRKLKSERFGAAAATGDQGALLHEERHLEKLEPLWRSQILKRCRFLALLGGSRNPVRLCPISRLFRN